MKSSSPNKPKKTKQDNRFLSVPLKRFYERKTSGSKAFEVNEYALQQAHKLFCMKLETIHEMGELSKGEVDFILNTVREERFDKVCLIGNLIEEYSQMLAIESGDKRIIISSRIVSTPQHYIALDWVLAQADSLYKGCVTWDIKRPFRQCLYCGNIRNSKGERFSLRGQNPNYCHAKDCKGGSSSNPTDHPDCCYGHWGLLYRRIRSRLNEVRGKNLTEHEKEYAMQAKFEVFLEELYEQNQSKAWEIQPESSKAQIEEGARALKVVVDREMLNRDQWDGIGRSDNEVRMIIEWYIQNVASYFNHGFKGTCEEFEKHECEIESAQWYAQKFLPLREPPSGLHVTP